MVLHRFAENLKAQNWAAVSTELLIIIVGVFIGLQVNTWNESRVETQRREQIVGAMATYLNDNIGVQEEFIAEIESGLTSWEAAVAIGEQRPPYFFRIEGSDTAPAMWSTFEQMQLTELFDPVTLFDLAFFFSELEGVGQKYVRYVIFVEEQVLPGAIGGHGAFYDSDGQLKSEFQANMDRLRDYQQESIRLLKWAKCLVYRLEAKHAFDQTCLRANFHLNATNNQPNDHDTTP